MVDPSGSSAEANPMFRSGVDVSESCVWCREAQQRWETQQLWITTRSLSYGDPWNNPDRSYGGGDWENPQGNRI
jgi:hypothetical protein